VPESSERTALYRLYDADGRLLYVGISYQPEKRFKEHAHVKTWWHHVKQKRIEWFASQEEALKAEAAAVKAEGPLYDNTHRFRKGWRIHPPRVYDTSEDVAAMTAAMRDALKTGDLQPGACLQAFRVAERFGYSRTIALEVLDGLAKEGLLLHPNANYTVPR
jgi:predicted GIY-YIG superfamily endonuclease